MRLQADNNAKTTLTDSIDPEDEIIKVASDLDLPSAPCRLTIDDGQNIEIVHLEEVLEEGLKVERGQEGTEAQSFSEGTGVDNRFTAGTYNELISNREFSTGHTFTIWNDEDEIVYAVDQTGKLVAGGKNAKNVEDPTDFGEVFEYVWTQDHRYMSCQIAPSYCPDNDTIYPYNIKKPVTVNRALAVYGAGKNRTFIEASWDKEEYENEYAITVDFTEDTFSEWGGNHDFILAGFKCSQHFNDSEPAGHIEIKGGDPDEGEEFTGGLAIRNVILRDGEEYGFKCDLSHLGFDETGRFPSFNSFVDNHFLDGIYLSHFIDARFFFNRIRGDLHLERITALQMVGNEISEDNITNAHMEEIEWEHNASDWTSIWFDEETQASGISERTSGLPTNLKAFHGEFPLTTMEDEDPILCFMFDDANSSVYEHKDVFIDNDAFVGLPAMPMALEYDEDGEKHFDPNDRAPRMNWTQLKEMVWDDQVATVQSHGLTHYYDIYDDPIDLDEIYKEFHTAYRRFLEHGFNPVLVVGPGHRIQDRQDFVESIGRQIHPWGLAGQSWDDESVEEVIENMKEEDDPFALHRFSMEYPYTVDEIKDLIDEAVANDVGLCLYGHEIFDGDPEDEPKEVDGEEDSQFVSTGKIEEVITYAKEQGMQMGTPEDYVLSITKPRQLGRYLTVRRDGTTVVEDIISGDIVAEDVEVEDLEVKGTLSGVDELTVNTITADEYTGDGVVHSDEQVVNFKSAVSKSDMQVTEEGQGIILTSPDGSETKRIYIDNDGNIATENLGE